MIEAPSKKVQILGVRNYFPKKVITNKDFEKILDTTDEWIVARTGIRERRRSEAHETPGFMGTEAAKSLLLAFHEKAEDIDLIICATITGDYNFPATAGIIQNNLGAKKAWAFDISAACSGFIFALETARSFVQSGLAKKVLVVAAEKMSSILNPTERATIILFGDGASACLVTEGNEKSHIIDSILKTDGSGVPFLYAPVGGSVTPITAENISTNEHYAKQDGRAVYKRAVVDMAEVCVEILNKHNLTHRDIKLLVPHQANMRIIESCAQRIGLSMSQVAINIHKYGNTTAATIPSALADAESEGKVSKGDLVLLTSFGAGFTWGATLMKY